MPGLSFPAAASDTVPPALGMQLLWEPQPPVARVQNLASLPNT